MKKIFTTLSLITLCLTLSAQCGPMFSHLDEEEIFVEGTTYQSIPGMENINNQVNSTPYYLEINTNGRPAEKLTFDAIGKKWGLLGWHGGSLHVAISSDGGETYSELAGVSVSTENYQSYGPYDVPENITNIVFYTLITEAARGYKDFKNIKITQKTFLTAISAMPEAFNLNYGEEAGFDFEFKYSNLPEAIHVSATTEEIALSETEIGSGCGDFQNSYQIHFDVNSTTAGVHNESVTLAAGDYSIVIPLNYTVSSPYTIASQPTATDIEIGQSLADATFEGGSVNTPGHFEWEDPTIVPQVGESQGFNAIFIPDNPSYPTQTITVYVNVNKMAQEIEFEIDLSALTVGDQIELTATATSGLEVSYSVSNESLATIEGNVLTALAAGDVDVYVSQAGNENYMPAVTITVYAHIEEAAPEKLNQTIAWLQDFDALTVGDRITLEASASSGLEVTYSLDSEEYAHIENGVLVADAAGTTMLYAHQEGNDQYNAAPDFVKFVIISEAQVIKDQQHIVWNQDFDVLHVGDVVELTATATSGLEISYSVNDETLASVNGNILTVLAAGELEITARQEGNAQYEAAAEELRYATITEADALPEISTEAAITVRGGVITVDAQGLSAVEIYNALGQLIASKSGQQQITVNLSGHQGPAVMVCHINGQRMSHKTMLK